VCKYIIYIIYIIIYAQIDVYTCTFLDIYMYTRIIYIHIRGARIVRVRVSQCSKKNQSYNQSYITNC